MKKHFDIGCSVGMQDSTQKYESLFPLMVSGSDGIFNLHGPPKEIIHTLGSTETEVIYPRSHNLFMAGLRLNSRSSDSKSHIVYK